MDYKSRQWHAKRKAILRRDRYQCRECRRFGIASNASVVHHAYPADDFPEYAWEEWNLVSLCAACHNAMHDRESGALTNRGLAWRRRVSPPTPAGPECFRKTGRERSLSDGGKNGRPGPTPRTPQENSARTTQTGRARKRRTCAKGGRHGTGSDDPG